MKRRILLSLATVALAVIVAVPANAECPSPQCFASAGTDTGNNVPVVFGAGLATDSATVVGRFWNADNFNNVNTGTCSEDIWLSNFLDPDPALYIIGFMGAGTCLNNGLCMPDSASFLLTVETKSLDNKSAAFTVARAKNTFVVGDPTSSCDYDFSRGAPGQMQMVPVPKPRVTSSSRAANTVTVNLSYDDTSQGFRAPVADAFLAPSSIIGYKLLEATSATDPGRDPGAWTVKRTDANAGGPTAVNGVQIDCTTGTAHWLATQVQFQGGSAPAVDGTYVGEAVQVRCDTNLANPGKLKPIEKKKIVPNEAH